MKTYTKQDLKKMSVAAHRANTESEYKRVCGSSKTAKEIWSKVQTREALTHKELPCLADILWGTKLQQIANILPTTGHSMGSVQRVFLKGTRIERECDRTEKYANSCKWHPTHGSLTLFVSAREVHQIQLLCGTAVIKGKKVPGKPAYSARWIKRQGEKRNANLRWVNGFLSNNSLGHPMLTYSADGHVK